MVMLVSVESGSSLSAVLMGYSQHRHYVNPYANLANSK